MAGWSSGTPFPPERSVTGQTRGVFLVLLFLKMIFNSTCLLPSLLFKKKKESRIDKDAGLLKILVAIIRMGERVSSRTSF